MASYYNAPQPHVEGWLDGQYEYMVPDKDIDDIKRKPSYTPSDAFRDNTPEYSDENASQGKGHPLHRDRYHSTAKERYTPASPPPEEELERERGRHQHGSGQVHRRDRDREVDQEEPRPRHDRSAKYPPKADHGRPRRPPLDSAATSPHLTGGKPSKDEEPEKRRHRRYSQSVSPTRHRGDKPSRHHHSRRHEDRSPSPPRSSRKKDDRDRDTRSHHSGSGHSTSSSTTKPHRPSLSHSQTAPYGKDPKKTGSSSRSFSFLNDPRFVTAAEAALQAGASAALASAGTGGLKWDSEKKAQVLRAGLGAAALSALKPPVTAPAPAPAEAAPAAAAPPPPPGPWEAAGDRAGRYAAGRVGRKGSTRRRHD